MDEKGLRSWVVILVLVAFLFILTGLSVRCAYGQEVLRPSGRIAPGPDSTPTWTPTLTPTWTPTPTRTPTPTPTPYPDPVERACGYVESPWGIPCDVRSVCSLQIVPMHIGTPQTTMLSLVTDQTKWTIFSVLRGPGEVSIDWHSPLKWAEWYVQGNDTPLQGCYCDERRGMVVICVLGKYEREVKP